MDPINLERQSQPEEPRFLRFRHLPENTARNGKPVLNRYSSTLTKDHDAPGAKVRAGNGSYEVPFSDRFRLCFTPLVYQMRRQ
jgi:hypothetical protein